MFSSNFPSNLEAADIWPTYEKRDKSDIEKRFWPTYNKQHFLLVMVEKWKEVLHYGSLEDALRKDLSNVFDYIKHDLLITKLCMYGFDCHSLSFIFSYHFFTIYWMKTKNKIHNSCCPYADIACGVPFQNSTYYISVGVLGNIFLLFVFF